MGIALADAAVEYGAEVELVLGPVSRVPVNNSINIINVISAESMASECLARFPGCDIAILAAAVADFTPEKAEGRKIKRTGDEIVLRLLPTKDIAQTLGKMKKSSQILAGFALETHNEIVNAAAKLRRKNLDLIVMNSMQDKGAGFGNDTNRITIIDRNNIIHKFELKSKEEVARDILDKIVSLLKSLPE
jgi:phosphopantothenoylcysteine decarboxylase/phosphopantothenate--cysteine ligase